jgi:hypothetical protein
MIRIACVAAVLLLAARLDAQEPTTPTSPPRHAPGGAGDGWLADWKYYVPLELPAEGGTEYYDFVVTPPVFDGAQLELHDLRLVDASGREVPYDLRLRAPRDRPEILALREFNRARSPDGASELSVEMLEMLKEHSSVRVQLSGQSYGRRAEVFGSDNGSDWNKLETSTLFDFREEVKEFTRDSIRYPPSRYRFLRVRVFPDPGRNGDVPDIHGIEVLHVAADPGEQVRLPFRLGGREATRVNEQPGSRWRLDLGGRFVPCNGLALDVADPSFSRDYQIREGFQMEQGGFVYTEYTDGGKLERLPGRPIEPVAIKFHEQRANWLELHVVDYANPPLAIRGGTFTHDARQVIFAAEPGLAGPLRLYFGNPRAGAPEYDFGRTLPSQVVPEPTRLAVGARLDNPGYVPPPLPFTERFPWVIYVFLSAASLVLAGVIVSVARAAIARHDAKVENAPGVG